MLPIVPNLKRKRRINDKIVGDNDCISQSVIRTKSMILKCQSLNFHFNDTLSLGVIAGFRAANRHKETISSHNLDADA